MTTKREEIAAQFRAALQPVYAELLRSHGIVSGDIDPVESFRLEQAEEALAEIVAGWIYFGLPLPESTRKKAGELVDGDSFSLDGENWHVFAVRGFGTVACYVDARRDEEAQTYRFAVGAEDEVLVARPEEGSP